MNINEANILIRQMEITLSKLKAALAEPIKVEEKPVEKPPEAPPKTLVELLDDPSWPTAVRPADICDESSEEDKSNRANDVLNVIIEQTLKDTKFLDYGCGEGHTIAKAKELGAITSVGYDIKSSGALTWEEEKDNTLLTTDFEKVKALGPYNVILLFDTIDHLEGESAAKALLKLKAVLAPGGAIYLRCHPFCSRHGGHLYKQKNKAFINLVFTQEELETMGYKTTPTNRVLFPLKTYKEYFVASGLLVKKENIDRDIVEPFFTNQEQVRNKILKTFERNPNGEFPILQMEQSFVDYVLSDPKNA